MIAKLLALLPLLERLVSLLPMMERQFGRQRSGPSPEGKQIDALEAGIANFLGELTLAAREQRRESMELRSRVETLLQEARVALEQGRRLEEALLQARRQMQMLWIVAVASLAGTVAVVVMAVVLLTRKS
jgi:hypothetical protein